MHVPLMTGNMANSYSGGHAPSYLYRIVADHYRSEDITL